MINQNLINQAVRFLQWAQALEDVVIPPGLEEDMKEAIISAQQGVQAELLPDSFEDDRKFFASISVKGLR